MSASSRLFIETRQNEIQIDESIQKQKAWNQLTSTKKSNRFTKKKKD